MAQGLTVTGPASSSTVWSGPLLKEGASLTGVTLMATVAVFESRLPSLALKVKLSAPLASGSGV